MTAHFAMMPAHTRFTPRQALDYVIQEDPREALIISVDDDGDILIRSSTMNRRDALWLIETARLHILGFDDDR